MVKEIIIIIIIREKRYKREIFEREKKGRKRKIAMEGRIIVTGSSTVDAKFHGELVSCGTFVGINRSPDIVK